MPNAATPLPSAPLAPAATAPRRAATASRSDGTGIAIKGDDGATHGFKGLCKELYRDVRRRHTAAALNDLTIEMAKAKTTHVFQEWLEMRSRFYPYSAYNCLLIGFQQMSQRGSTDLAQSAEAFKAIGRTVKPDAKPIIILGPWTGGGRTPPAVTHTTPATDGADGSAASTAGTAADPAPTPGSRGVRGAFSGRPRFVDLKIFDVRDTEGAPMPQLKAPLPGDFDPFIAAVQAEAAARGCAVTLENMSAMGSTYGYSAGNKIVVAADKGTSATRTGTLFHELAHEVLHHDDSQLRADARASIDPGSAHLLTERRDGASKMTREIEAEAVKYVVSRAMGLPDGGNAARYLAAWTHDDANATPSQIKERFERIDIGVERVMDIIRGALPRMSDADRAHLNVAPFMLERPTDTARRKREALAATRQDLVRPPDPSGLDSATSLVTAALRDPLSLGLTGVVAPPTMDVRAPRVPSPRPAANAPA